MHLSRRNLIIYLVIAFILLLGFSGWAYFKDLKHIIGLIGLIGALTSTFGLGIVLIQVSSLHSASEAAKKAAEKTQTRLLEFLSVVDIARTVKIAQEIQSFNRSEKWEISILRMQDLKYVLRDILNNPQIRQSINPDRYKNHIKELSLQIGSLDKEIKRPAKSFNVAKMNIAIEAILNDLIDLDTRVKHLGGRNVR